MQTWPKDSLLNRFILTFDWLQKDSPVPAANEVIEEKNNNSSNQSSEHISMYSFEHLKLIKYLTDDLLIYLFIKEWSFSIK